MKPICFVMQPFIEPYHRLYETMFVPAIREAGLEPYRVDQDPSVTIVIDAIERNIREAAICLADITEDNPNVWFEVGLALGHGKDVCMVCNRSRRERFPFDVAHRYIIRYGSKDDDPLEFYVELKNRLAARVQEHEEKAGTRNAEFSKPEYFRQIVNESTAAAITGQGVLATASIEDARRLLGLDRRD